MKNKGAEGRKKNQDSGVQNDLRGNLFAVREDER